MGIVSADGGQRVRAAGARSRCNLLSMLLSPLPSTLPSALPMRERSIARPTLLMRSNEFGHVARIVDARRLAVCTCRPPTVSPVR